MLVPDLIDFVQRHYPGSPNSDERARERDPNAHYQRSPDEDPNAVPRGRLAAPDWIPEEGDASVISVGSFDSLSIEEDVPVDASETVGRAEGIDTLAYYLPYHFYPSSWGIYLKGSGLLYLASLLKEGQLTPGDNRMLELSHRILFEHEFFHFVAETGCSRAEVVKGQALYKDYFDHPFAWPHEEALANAHAFRKIRRALTRQPPRLKDLIGGWMKKQGFGYGDYHLWLTSQRFRNGCRRAAHYMLRPFDKPTFPPIPVVKQPTEFLFSNPKLLAVPTRIVVDHAALGILKAFPKHKGIVIKVHRRDEHPPPHFHIYKTDGRTLISKYRWPELKPYDEKSVVLTGSLRKNLTLYLEKFGAQIGEEIRRVPGFWPKDR